MWWKANPWSMAQAIYRFWYGENCRANWANTLSTCHTVEQCLAILFTFPIDLQHPRVKRLHVFAQCELCNG
jgi:hypothetical protein